MAITYPPEMLPKADGTAEVLVQNNDGSFRRIDMATFRLPDPYKDMTLPQVKDRARKLGRALARWQQMAMALASGRKVESLPPEWRDEINRHIEAYKD